MNSPPESPTETVILSLKRGRAVLLEDDLSSEPRACLFAAAHSITPQTVMALVESAQGTTSAVLSAKRTLELGLLPMMPRQTPDRDYALVSVEARQGVTTGISAEDRARTLHVLASTQEPRRDLVTPGHIFPYRAREGGVLVRASLLEACIDLLKAGGLPEVAAFAWCLDENGLFRCEGFDELAANTNAPIIKLSTVVRSRLSTETLVEEIADAAFPSAHGGSFRALCFRSAVDGSEHFALIKGDRNSLSKAPVLVRVQSEHRLGDLLGLAQRPTRQSLKRAIQTIEAQGAGVIIYIRHAQPGVVLEQIQSLARGDSPIRYASQLREFGIGAQILKNLGISRIRLLSNSEQKFEGLHAFGLEVIEQVAF